MRRLLLAFLCAGFLPLVAQEAGPWRLPGAAELRARYRRKLAAPFVRAVPWRRHFDQALAEARRRGCLVLAYFTRSYAPSRPCEALEGGPLRSRWWRAAAARLVPYLNVEARLPAAPDQGLILRLGGTAFPYAALVDGRGRVLAAFHPRSREALETALDRAHVMAELLDTPDPEAPHVVAARILLNALQRYDPPSLDVLDSLARFPHLDPRVAYLYERERGFVVWRHKLATLRRALAWVDRNHPAGRAARDRRLYRLYREGFRLEPRERPGFAYAAALALGAARAGDAAVARTYLRLAETAAATLLTRNGRLAAREEAAGYGGSRHAALRRIYAYLLAELRRRVTLLLGDQ